MLDVQASDFLTIGLLVALEGLLSADNALVHGRHGARLPRKHQQKALRFGLIGGFGLRIIATVLAVYLIRIAWVKLLGGVYLLYLPWQHFAQERRGRSAADAAKPAPCASACPPLGHHRRRSRWSNLAFSVDSILVAVAMSPKAVGGHHRRHPRASSPLRLVVGQLLALIQRYPALVDGAFVIIAWVGIKLLLEYLHNVHLSRFEIPKWLSLGLIIVIFVGAFWFTLAVKGPRQSSG